MYAIKPIYERWVKYEKNLGAIRQRLRFVRSRTNVGKEGISKIAATTSACVCADLRLRVAFIDRFLDQLVEHDEQGVGREGEAEAREDGRVEDGGGDEVMIGVEDGGGL